MWKKLIGSSISDAVLAAMNKSLAIIEFDPAGSILTANDNFLHAMGYEARELAGQHHRMFVDTDYARSAEYAAFWQKLGRGEFDAAEYKRLGKADAKSGFRRPTTRCCQPPERSSRWSSSLPTSPPPR